MTEANPEVGAAEIEVTDVDSAAQAIEARMEAREPQVTEKVEEPVTDEVTEEPEEESPESDELDETDESDESDEREADSEESEDPQFHSVSELAEALELSPEDFEEQITAKVKVNGEEKEVNLAELRKGYQLESDYRQKTMELADNRRAFEEAVQQKNAELTAKVQEATHMVATLEQSMIGEYQNVDWNTLRVTDPAEYAALHADYQNRIQSIEQIKAQALNANGQLQSEQAAKQEQARQEILKKESEALLSVIPEWREPEVAKKEKGEMRNFLKQYNFSDEEIGQLADHRIVMMIRDAQKGQQVVTKTDVAKKKVIKAPKLQKAGAKQSKQTQRSKQQNDLRAKLRKSGKVDDVAALLLARQG